MSGRLQRWFTALAALPVLILLLSPAELMCCASSMISCGAGGDADCCDMHEESAAARDCCDGPQNADHSSRRDVSKPKSFDVALANPAGDGCSPAPRLTAKPPRAPSGEPPDDLKALHSVLLI